MNRGRRHCEMAQLTPGRASAADDFTFLLAAPPTKGFSTPPTKTEGTNPLGYGTPKKQGFGSVLTKLSLGTKLAQAATSPRNPSERPSQTPRTRKTPRKTPRTPRQSRWGTVASVFTPAQSILDWKPEEVVPAPLRVPAALLRCSLVTKRKIVAKPGNHCPYCNLEFMSYQLRFHTRICAIRHALVCGLLAVAWIVH